MATTRHQPEYELACPKCGTTGSGLGVRQARVVYCKMDILDIRGWSHNVWEVFNMPSAKAKGVATCVGEPEDAETSKPVFLCYTCGHDTKSETRFRRVTGGTQ